MGQELGKHQPKVTSSPKDMCGTSPQKGFNNGMDGMIHLFENLAALSPHHNFIDKATFVHYFPLDGILADRLFTAFDQDKNGVIDVKEFLGGLALCLSESLDDKYKVVFDMFNLDGSDGVSAYELELVLKPMMPAAVKILRARESHECYSSSEVELDLLVSRIVHDAFEQCDSGKSGKLRWTEFKRWMARNPFVLDSVFNRASLMDKHVQYSRLEDRQKSNSYESTRPPSGISELRSQTWVNDEARHEKLTEVNAQSFTGSYVGAEYLWSPVFAVNTAVPCARSKHAACLYDGAVFVLGGRSSSGSLKDFWRFDPGSNMWSHVVALGETRPPSLQEHTVVAREGKYYVFGGEFTSSPETPLWIFDLNELLWKKQGSKCKGPVNRRSHTAVLFEDAMFIFGGFIDLRSATSELWKYEFDSRSWIKLKWLSSDCPGPRYCHSAVVHDRAMWVFGGLEGVQAKNDFWRLSLDFYTWSRIKSRGGPPGLFGHSVAVVGDGMLVFGGETSDGSLVNTLWRFDFEFRSWSTVRPRGRISPPVRSGHTMVALPSTAFLQSSRPTTSRSDPPPTPQPYAPFKGGGEDGEKRPSSSPSTAAEANVVMREGSRCVTPPLHSRVTHLKSAASLGSLISAETEGSTFIHRGPMSSSVDSIVGCVKRSEPAAPSALPEVKVSYDLVDIEPIHRIHPARTVAEVTSAGETRGQSLLAQMYKPRRTGPSSPLESVYSPHRVVQAKDRSLNSVISNSVRTMDRGVVCLLVLGGKLKNSVDMYGRTVDTWACVVDPVKSKGERVRTIVVERNQESHSTKNRQRIDSTKNRLSYGRLTPDGNETEQDARGSSECVLTDIVDGDTCSVDLLLDDDGCSYPSAYYGDLQHYSGAGPTTVSI